MCQEEMDKMMLERHVLLERICGQRENPETDETEYLCKWEELQYNETTWEDGDVLVSLGFQVPRPVPRK